MLFERWQDGQTRHTTRVDFLNFISENEHDKNTQKVSTVTI